MEQPKWVNSFITRNLDGSYTAWDETQAEEVGTFSTKQEAIDCIISYANSLEYGNIE